MKRFAVLLGFYATAGQILLLRELFSTLNGNEIFMATALFAWLVSTAAGALGPGGRRTVAGIRGLFMCSALLLPVMLAGVRVSPLFFSGVIGVVIPFGKAAMISILAVGPVGYLSGRLFTLICRLSDSTADTIVTVYLYEGIGACIGGCLTALCVGPFFSPLTLGLALGGALAAAVLIRGRMICILVSAAFILLGAVAMALTPRLNDFVDAIRYRPYSVIRSFDTHEGHQLVLERDSSRVLLTDNAIEAVEADRETVENQVLAGFAYCPGARKILYLGRSEMGAALLAASIPGLQLTQLDSRKELTAAFDALGVRPGVVRRIDANPIAYLTAVPDAERYDLIILNTGEPDTYRVGRFITGRFLAIISRLLAANGVVVVPTRYDSDRYLQDENRRVLSTIYRTLQASFCRVNTWPGTTTLFFASNSADLDLPYDTIVSRLADAGAAAVYLNPDYLADRLSTFKTERLCAALGTYNAINSINRPLLIHAQALFRARADAVDRWLFTAILGHPRWIIIIPVCFVVLFLLLLRRREGVTRFPLFLLFTAGVVSLSLEIAVFYLYQSTAGSLYTDIAVLIGAFMLGLTAGAWQALRSARARLLYPALSVLVAAPLLIAGVFDRLPLQALLGFYAIVLFITAAAAGIVFAGATRLYYKDDPEANRGAGYAAELLGSSLGALLTATIFLPVIGVQWLCVALAALSALAIAGAWGVLSDEIRFL
jgi:spermidine synthase